MTRCPAKTCGYTKHQKRSEKQKKERTCLRESRRKLDEWEAELNHELRQPSVEEIEDEYNLELRMRQYIIDPYEWDPSEEH
jgi:hypothetical protein